MNELARQAEHIERLRQARSPEFIGAVTAFYEPFDPLPKKLRQGHEEAIAPALLFLEADPWCFRSGYLKADLMLALANGPEPGRYRPRMQRVVLHRLEHPEPRLGKATARLAARVWDKDLDESFAKIATDPHLELADAVRTLRAAILHQQQTEAGA